jgi:cell division protein ZapA (FtsZ GTPase activity inhibitor)
MSELIPINIVIADRTYRIKTTVNDEEIIRKTVKMINDKIFEFKEQFAGKDMQDYIAMVIIWYATQNVGGDGNSMLNKEIVDALMKMEKQLDEKLDV